MLIPVPFATKDDLAARWRTLSTAEQATATMLLGDASNLIISEYPTSNVIDDADTALQTTRALTLKRIVCAMVKRSMPKDGDENDGEAATEIQQTAGPFGYRVKVLNPSGDLYLTGSERKSIYHQQAFTIPMAYDVDELS
jgi:hypothetical protein